MPPLAAAQDPHELRPAAGVLLRHRGADLVVHPSPRGGPRVELRQGALWIRAVEEGPGVTVTHGASSIQLRAGAVVVEVHDVEALLLVAAGSAAVKGTAPLPRSVAAGQAVALTLDGTTSEPDSLAPHELAADQMVVENLVRDVLASRRPVPHPPLPATAELVGATERLRARPELVLRSDVLSVRSEPSALETALANVGVTDAPPARPGSVPGDPLGTILEGNGHERPPVDGARSVDGRAPGPGAAALLVDDPAAPAAPIGSEEAATVEAPAAEEPAAVEAPAEEAPAEEAATRRPPADAGPSPSAAPDEAARRRKILALVVVAMILLASIAAVVLTASG